MIIIFAISRLQATKLSDAMIIIIFAISGLQEELSRALFTSHFHGGAVVTVCQSGVCTTCQQVAHHTLLVT